MEKDIRIKLKDMVHSSGCNAKLPPGDLRAVLENIPHYSDEKLIGGYEKKGDRQNTFSCGKRMGETKRSEKALHICTFSR